MQQSKKTLVVLFALVNCLRRFNSRFESDSLEVSVSKIEFIRLLKETGTIDKSERGLYRNLEVLEKEKLILYKARNLQLSKKGLKLALKLEKDVAPYLAVLQKLKDFKLKEGAQSRFK